MTILQIFERVNLTMPIEQRKFFDFFEDTVSELLSMYGGFVFDKSREYQPPKILTDENAVLPLFHQAIVDNIIFMAGGGDVHKSEFIRKSNNAYLKYWNDNAKSRKMKIPRG